MRVIIMGPQGAGKGTQAEKLVEEMGAAHIATGDLVREEIRKGSELGQKVKEYSNRGELVPDEIIIEMAKPHLSGNESWVLDGFPRNLAQAKALHERLEEMGAEVDKRVAREAPDDALVERLSGRRTSEATGRVYHVEYNPPPDNDEEDPGPFVQREDDTEEVIRNRLKTYREQTEPLKDYYGKQGILVTVDATKEISEVTKDVLRAVREDS